MDKQIVVYSYYGIFHNNTKNNKLSIYVITLNESQKHLIRTKKSQTHEKMLNIPHCQENANQNYNEIFTSHWSEWLLSKRQKKSVGEDVEKREPAYTAGRNVNGFRYYGKQYEGSSKI